MLPLAVNGQAVTRSVELYQHLSPSDVNVEISHHRPVVTVGRERDEQWLRSDRHHCQ
jgi:hypothetical protein